MDAEKLEIQSDAEVVVTVTCPHLHMITDGIRDVVVLKLEEMVPERHPKPMFVSGFSKNADLLVIQLKHNPNLGSAATVLSTVDCRKAVLDAVQETVTEALAEVGLGGIEEHHKSMEEFPIECPRCGMMVVSLPEKGQVEYECGTIVDLGTHEAIQIGTDCETK